MNTPHSKDYTVVFLPDPQWNRFLELATRANRKHQSGGWQDRLRKWLGQMDDARQCVWLSHQTDRPRRLDDMTFVAHAIEQRNIGGWQLHAYQVFEGVHPRFTGLTIRPRPPRKPRA